MSDSTPFDEALALHQEDRLQEAVDAYRAILTAEPENGAVMLNLGQALRRLGRAEESEALYRQATGQPASAAGAWYNLGNLSASRQNFEQAIAAFRKAIELQPEMSPAHFQLACCLRDTGITSDAIEGFRTAISLDPKLTSAHMNLGNLLRASGDLPGAAIAHRAALALTPESWEVRYNLARALEEAGDAEAEAHFEYALDLSPQPATVHHGFADAAAARGNFTIALEQYQSALALEPQRRRAQIGLGRAQMRLGQREQALREFADVSAKIGTDIQLLSELATVQWSLKLREEPIALLRRVVQLAPDNPDALVNLARALSSVWEISECVEMCERALVIAPDNNAARRLQGYALVEAGRANDGIAAFTEVGEPNGGPNASLLFSTLYSDTMTAGEVADLHRTEGAKWPASGRLIESYGNVADPVRKLRIGYLSPDFKGNHPVAIFLKPLLRNHERKSFEIFAYSSPDYVDETTQEIAALADHWRDVTTWSNERLTAAIETDEIDILVDLAGLTAKTRVGALQAHPAPIQACYIGYPHSTGLPFIDYLICDETVVPSGSEHLLIEAPLRVDDCVFCFAPDDSDWPAIEPEIATARDHVVFGSCNHVPKLTETTVSLWARILGQVPNSRLRIKAAPFTDAAIRQRYRNLFAGHGIAPERIDIDGPSEFPDLMATYRHIDIGLDPVPYNGGTTTYQTLWMGVPVVTLAGENFCGRMSASILGNLGLDELIAESEEDYIRAAVRLAEDAPRRAELRIGLRETIRNARSCDPAAFTLNLETKFREIWRDWCARRNAA
ncbi:MAG: tetratricopeptide repeat protein [Alphaproteobacteria bacterium]|jgi:protein O-GlcNAc transferase|nr:tetratricopeptide repeat protein [Alphaproteobacteria bacterium]